MRHTRRWSRPLLSGIWTGPRPPRGGWNRADPGDGGGDGSSGGGPAGGGANDGAGADDGDGKKPTFTGDFDPEKAKAAIAAARAGEKAAIAAAKTEKDRVAAILKAAGLAPDGKADPEQQLRELTERATAAEQRATALATRDAVRTAADKHKADAGELLDSTKFTTQLAELDPSASDYPDKVGDLVKQAVKDNPAKYGTTGVKGGGTRSGSGDHTGGGHRPARSSDLNSAVARKLAG